MKAWEEKMAIMIEIISKLTTLFTYFMPLSG